MFERLICKLLGIEVSRNKDGVTISLAKMAKRHPDLTKKLITNFAVKMAAEGANVVCVSNDGSKKHPDNPEN